MKKIIMMAIACTIAMNSNAQALVGSRSADSLLLITNDTTRMYIDQYGRVSVNNARVIDGSSRVSRMSIMKKTPPLNLDNTALLLLDNNSAVSRESQLGIINYYSNNGLYVYSHGKTTSPYNQNNYGIVSEGGTAGIHRKNIITFFTGSSNSSYGIYNMFEFRLDGGDAIANNLVGYTSTGTGFTSECAFNSLTDILMQDWFGESSGTWGPRYGLKLDFQKQGSAAAWGVYQSQTTTLNHFNGATLFGTTTDNTFDKAQVTGGTNTDGFAAGLAIKTTDYTLLNTDYTILCNGQVDITLPTSGIATGKIYVIKKVSTSGTTVTFTGTIDGNASYTALSAQYEGLVLQYNGTDYSIIGKF